MRHNPYMLDPQQYANNNLQGPLGRGNNFTVARSNVQGNDPVGMSDSIVSGQQGGFKAPQAAVDNSPSLMSTLGSAAGSAAGGYIGGEVIGMALTPALGPLGPIVGKALGSALGGSLGGGSPPPPAQTPTGPEENALKVPETVVAAPPPLNPGLASAQSAEEEQKYYNRLGGNTYGF